MYSMFPPAIGFAFFGMYDHPGDSHTSSIPWLALFLMWARSSLYGWV
jgi:hypothetical protein